MKLRRKVKGVILVISLEREVEVMVIDEIVRNKRKGEKRLG